MKPFAYASPGSLDETLALLGRPPASEGEPPRPLAGGTDLLTLMKAGVAAPIGLVDIKRVAELDDAIVDTGDGLLIGALATLAEIETDPLVRALAPALAEAAEAAATPQLRNMATIGGNLLQRPRCWYYRNPRFHCWLKEGEVCQARDGENQLHAVVDRSPCVAVHPSDLATALVSLDAEVRLRGPKGERTLPLGEFFAPPTAERRRENVLDPDELILAVRVPPQPEGARGTYLKAMDRKVWAFALVGVAARMRVEGGRIADARIVLGGVANVPHRAAAAERALLGAEPTAAVFARAADAALDGAVALGENAYKLPLARALVRRALGGLAAEPAGGNAIGA